MAQRHTTSGGSRIPTPRRSPAAPMTDPAQGNTLSQAPALAPQLEARIAALSTTAIRASSCGAKAGACERVLPCAGSVIGAAGERLGVGIREPPEVVCLCAVIDHRQFRMSECVQTLRAE